MREKVAKLSAAQAVLCNLWWEPEICAILCCAKFTLKAREKIVEIEPDSVVCLWLMARVLGYSHKIIFVRILLKNRSFSSVEACYFFAIYLKKLISYSTCISFQSFYIFIAMLDSINDGIWLRTLLSLWSHWQIPITWLMVSSFLSRSFCINCSMVQKLNTIRKHSESSDIHQGRSFS